MRRNRKCKKCGYELKTIEVAEEGFDRNDKFIADLRKLIDKYYH